MGESSGRPPSGGKKADRGGGFWGFVSNIFKNTSFEVNIGGAPSRPVTGNPTDPAARMAPVKEDRRETYDEMVYRTTDGEDGQAPAARVNRERQHVARSIDERRNAAAGHAPIPESGGEPLSKDVRARMEPRLGADLSDVRLHKSGESASAAEGLSAKAFTVGNDVHFGSGNYQPGTKEGDRLIAHELTHVVQGKRAGVQRKADDAADAEHAGPTVSDPAEPAEKEADAVGDHVANDLHGGKPPEPGKGPAKAAGSAAAKPASPDKAGDGASAPSQARNDHSQAAGAQGTAGESKPGAQAESAPKEKAPAIGAKLTTGIAGGKKIFRLPNNPQPKPAAGPPGSTKPGSTNAPPAPVTVPGTMKGQPHTLTADAGAHTVKLDNADAIAAAQAAKAALPESGDPRYAEANAQIAGINSKLQQLSARVSAGTPPTTAELRQLSQETMRAIQAFGDRFDVKRLGDPLPQFPSPIVGPHPLTGAKPPDNSSRNSHHVPPKELAQAIASEVEQAANQMLGGPDATELTPAAQRMMQAVGQIRANGNGNGLTAILIHQLTHQAAGGSAVHSATMKAQILAGLTKICQETQRERILIMNNAKKGLPEGLSVNPNATQFVAFMQQARTQAGQIRDEKRKQQAQQQLQQAEGQEQQLTTRAQSREANEAMQLVHQQAQVAFHNAFGQAKSALRAALMASHVDGPPDGRQAALGQVDAQAPQTWAPILNAGG
jgi:hypothetical protein